MASWDCHRPDPVIVAVPRTQDSPRPPGGWSRGWADAGYLAGAFAPNCRPIAPTAMAASMSSRMPQPISRSGGDTRSSDFVLSLTPYAGVGAVVSSAVGLLNQVR